MRNQQKYFICPLILSVILALFLSVPAFGAVSDKYSDPFISSDNNILGRLYYSESNGKIQIKAEMDYARVVKWEQVEFYAADASGTITVREDVSKSDLENTGGGYYEYTFQHLFAGGTSIKIGAYGFADEKKQDADMLSDAFDVTIASIVGADASENGSSISMSEKKQTISGTFPGGANGRQASSIMYELKAAKDAYFQIDNYTNSGSEDVNWLGVYTDKDDAATGSRSYAKVSTLNNIDGYWVSNILSKGESFYIIVSGYKGDTYSFDVTFRKYVHAKTKWTVKEGNYKKAFGQKKTLHITFEITNSDSDSYIAEDEKWYAPGTHGSLTVSKKGRKATFTYKTGDSAGKTPITIAMRGLDGKGKLNIITGLDVSKVTMDATTGPNYIILNGFVFKNSYEINFGTTVNVYLKSGSSWKKKLSVKSGTTKQKKISGLKTDTNYTYKLEFVKKLSDGTKVNGSKTFSVKTGPAGKPVIASATAVPGKDMTITSEGYWDGNGIWQNGTKRTFKTYQVTVTLASSLPNGCKGLYWNGEMIEGNGKTFTFNALSTVPSTISVAGFSNSNYGGLTAYSDSVNVKK